MQVMTTLCFTGRSNFYLKTTRKTIKQTPENFLYNLHKKILMGEYFFKRKNLGKGFVWTLATTPPCASGTLYMTRSNRVIKPKN